MKIWKIIDINILCKIWHEIKLKCVFFMSTGNEIGATLTRYMRLAITIFHWVNGSGRGWLHFTWSFSVWKPKKLNYLPIVVEWYRNICGNWTTTRLRCTIKFRVNRTGPARTRICHLKFQIILKKLICFTLTICSSSSSSSLSFLKRISRCPMNWEWAGITKINIWSNLQKPPSTPATPEPYTECVSRWDHFMHSHTLISLCNANRFPTSFKHKHELRVKKKPHGKMKCWILFITWLSDN